MALSWIVVRRVNGPSINRWLSIARSWSNSKSESFQSLPWAVIRRRSGSAAWSCLAPSHGENSSRPARSRRAYASRPISMASNSALMRILSPRTLCEAWVRRSARSRRSVSRFMRSRDCRIYAALDMWRAWAQRVQRLSNTSGNVTVMVLIDTSSDYRNPISCHTKSRMSDGANCTVSARLSLAGLLTPSTPRLHRSLPTLRLRRARCRRRPTATPSNPSGRQARA